MVRRDEIVGQRIFNVVESQESEQVSGLGESDWAYYRWYLNLENRSIVHLDTEGITVIPEFPEAVCPARVNATKWVTGEEYFRDGVFVSEEIRRDLIARTTYARQHTLLSEDATTRLLQGQLITEVIVSDQGPIDRQLILVLNERNHLAVWCSESGNLLQFDELHADRDICAEERYRLYFDNSPCDTFGRQ